jgi:serine phosphatase RsbU (regulator of sigma subunit)
MRCAYASTTCPAGDDVPGSTGGDIVAVVETSATVRVLVGDVMGHGARAGETAAEVKNAFRRLAAHEEDPPQVIAARLDRLIADREQRAHAAAMDAAEKQRRRDRAAFLEALPSVPPLGLLSLAGDAWPRSFPLAARAGDTVLLYTDGVTEARDPAGAVYPFDGRVTAVARRLDAAGEGPLDKPAASALIEALRADLLTHVGGVLRDDATLMYLGLANDPCPSAPPSRDTISRAR